MEPTSRSKIQETILNDQSGITYPNQQPKEIVKNAPKTENLSVKDDACERKDLDKYKVTDAAAISSPKIETDVTTVNDLKNIAAKVNELSLSTQDRKKLNIRLRLLATTGKTQEFCNLHKQYGSILDINSTGPDGNTALHFAALQDHRSIIKTLLNIDSIDPGICNDKGQTATSLATNPATAALLSAAVQQMQKEPSQHSAQTSSTLSMEGGTIKIVRKEPLTLETLQYRAKIAEDFHTVLKELVPSLPKNSQIVELACGDCTSAVAYPQLYGHNIHFLGIDNHLNSIQESRLRVERYVDTGVDFKFYHDDASKFDKHWPIKKKIDLLVIRNPSVANSFEEWAKIFNTAAKLGASQLLVTTTTKKEMDAVLHLVQESFTKDKELSFSGHQKVAIKPKMDKNRKAQLKPRARKIEMAVLKKESKNAEYDSQAVLLIPQVR